MVLDRIGSYILGFVDEFISSLAIYVHSFFDKGYLYKLNALIRIKQKINQKVYFLSQVQEIDYLELTTLSCLQQNIPASLGF